MAANLIDKVVLPASNSLRSLGGTFCDGLGKGFRGLGFRV